MKVTVEKQPKSQVKIDVVVEKAKVREAYDQALDERVKTTTIDGFREGKAPREQVEKKVGTAQLQGDAVNKLLETYYPQAVKEKLINPISNPKVTIQEFDVEKDFEFSAIVAVKPEIKIKDYEKELETYFAEKKKQISQVNAEKLKKGEKIESDQVRLHPSEVIEAVLKASECEVPQLLAEEEANRMLARLINQAQAVGMSLEEYLQTQNKTADELREEYETSAAKNIKAELVLSELVIKEKVVASDKEIEDAVRASGAENVEEQLNNPVQKVYIKSVLEKNKLIQQIIEKMEGAKDEK
ncbi:trigger factor [Patescibacteria group bacterium]